MTEKVAVELGNVQITLLLPLWGRAVETQKKKPLLRDAAAAEIISKIDYDFRTIAGNISEITRFEWIARSLYIDRTIETFLQKYPHATVVNIGCGLDTTFERTDNGKLLWYDLDLPDAIALRKNFLQETERRKFISYSFLDEGWFREIKARENVLFIAAGVMYYFEEAQVKQILNSMASYFTDSEFIFDAASPMGVETANKKVIQRSGLDERSFLKWGIASALEIPKWHKNIELIREYAMFKGLTTGLTLRNKILALISDRYRIMYMVHLRFGKG